MHLFIYRHKIFEIIPLIPVREFGPRGGGDLGGAGGTTLELQNEDREAETVLNWGGRREDAGGGGDMPFPLNLDRDAFRSLTASSLSVCESIRLKRSHT